MIRFPPLRHWRQLEPRKYFCGANSKPSCSILTLALYRNQTARLLASVFSADVVVGNDAPVSFIETPEALLPVARYLRMEARNGSSKSWTPLVQIETVRTNHVRDSLLPVVDTKPRVIIAPGARICIRAMGAPGIEAYKA